MNKDIAIVVLAAGCSSRLGRNKLLVKIEGMSLIKRQCEMLHSFGFPTYCVVGFQSKDVRSEISALPITIIENKDWQQGLASSIRIASNIVAEHVKQVVYVLADQWRLNHKAMASFIEFTRLNPQNIAVASQKSLANNNPLEILDHIGPPVSFPKSVFTELTQLEEGTGAKKIIKQHLDIVMPYVLPEAFIDLDTPEQLARLRDEFPF